MSSFVRSFVRSARPWHCAKKSTNSGFVSLACKLRGRRLGFHRLSRCWTEGQIEVYARAVAEAVLDEASNILDARKSYIECKNAY